MAIASVEFRRLLLRGIAWDAEKLGIRLREALKAACQGRLEESKAGQQIVGVSGNGASLTFALPQSSSELTPSRVLNAVSQLYDLYEQTLAELETDEVTATDSAITARMLRLLVRRNEVYTDRSAVLV